MCGGGHILLHEPYDEEVHHDSAHTVNGLKTGSETGSKVVALLYNFNYRRWEDASIIY